MINIDSEVGINIKYKGHGMKSKTNLIIGFLFLIYSFPAISSRNHLTFCEDPKVLDLFKIKSSAQNKEGVHRLLLSFPEIYDLSQLGFRNCLDGLKIKKDSYVHTSDYFLSFKVYDSNDTLISVVPLYYRKLSIQSDHSTAGKQWIFMHIPAEDSTIRNIIINATKNKELVFLEETTLQNLSSKSDLFDILVAGEDLKTNREEAREFFESSFQLSEVTHFMGKEANQERYFLASWDRLSFSDVVGKIISKQLMVLKNSPISKNWTFYTTSLFQLQNYLGETKNQTQATFREEWQNYLCKSDHSQLEKDLNLSFHDANENVEKIDMSTILSDFINDRDESCKIGRSPRSLASKVWIDVLYRFIKNQWIMENSRSRAVF